MKRYFTILLFLLLAILLPAQQAKQVYITLDVSGSMTGNKYALANYTTQMIITLCDEDDEVHMIVYGVEENLSKNNSPLNLIQKPKIKLQFGKPTSGMSQFDDIIGFNKVYKPSNQKQNWLFIIGDGVWDTPSPQYKEDREKFRKIIEEGSLNVCYLQTEHKLDAHTDFTVFADSLGIIDIRKSDINPSTIKDGCDHFARKILGFSEIPLKVKKSGGKCISIKAELPLKEFYLVYQDEVKPNQLPKIENVTYGSNSLQAKLKGTPTTEPLKTDLNEVDLSGHVFHVKGSGVIPANTIIEVCFDKDINSDNVIVYPIVENVEFGSINLTRAGSKLKKLDSNTFSICQDESKALVRIELNEESSKNLPESLLEKSKVVVKANSKDYNAKYNNGGFECEIDLPEAETQYYAECDCPGYFKRVTPITKIVKGDCPPEKPVDVPVSEMPVAELGTISFETLKHDKIAVYLQDSITHQVLNPELFDISFDIENDFLYEDPVWHIKNDTIILELRPKGEWCECLFPEDLNIKLVSSPKTEAFQEYGKNYRKTIFPVHLTVVKDRPWLSRCLWVIICLVALLLLIIYLRALLKKNRFHKRARLRNSYVTDDNSKETEKNGKRLRRPGFGAWFNRWFNPFVDENNTINFSRPKTKAMRFTASESKNRILMSEANFDPATMYIPNYNPRSPEEKKKKEEPISISSGISIEIKKTQAGESSTLGHLTFVIADGKDDVRGYQIFIGLLMAAAILAFITLVVLLINSYSI